MIPLRDQDAIRQRFARDLKERVKIDLFTQREPRLAVAGKPPCLFCEPVQQALEELAALSDDKLTLNLHFLDEAPPSAEKYSVERAPCTLIRTASGRRFKFYGFFGALLFPAFIDMLVLSSQGDADLAPEVKKGLKRLKEPLSVWVFTTPDAPAAPRMVRSAFRLSLASPKITLEVVEVAEFSDLIQRLGIQAVPMTILDAKLGVLGATDEAGLLQRILEAVEGREPQPLDVQDPPVRLVLQQPQQRQPARKPASKLVVPGQEGGGKRTPGGLIIPGR
jgi:hypothetical protein